MFRRWYRTTQQLLAHWRKQPFGALLLLMALFTAIGGPAVCVLDCWLHDLRAAQHDPQGLHQQHAVVESAGQDTSGARHEQHHNDGDGHTPSALTIAVVLAIVLLLPLNWARRQPFEAGLLAGLLAPPPPPRPPRCSFSFVFTAV